MNGDRDQLDKQSVINALTDGIGAAFGRAARRSFYEQLQRMQTLRQFERIEFDNKQQLVDLLALASFHQSVVVPIESARNFLGVLRKAGATHLRVGGDKLDWRYGIVLSALSLAFTRFSPISRLGAPLNLSHSWNVCESLSTVLSGTRQ